MTTRTTPVRPTAVAGVALAALLGLSACGDGSSTVASDGGSSSPSATASDAPFNDQDVSFVKDMKPHHEQAVEMAETILAKDPRPEVEALAERIKAAQEPEIQQLDAMLAAFDVEDDAAGGHGGGHGGSSQPRGSMGDEDVQDLEDATGTQAERLFLEGMLEHHDGAVEMATEEIDAGAYPRAIALAEQVKAQQQAEIGEMRKLLGEA